MSLFPNKNQKDLQSTPTPALIADIPNDELRPWWSQVRRVLTDQLYKIQNAGIFNAPTFTNATIKQLAASEVTIVGEDGSTGQFKIVAGALVYVGGDGTETTVAPA